MLLMLRGGGGLARMVSHLCSTKNFGGTIKKDFMALVKDFESGDMIWLD
jgi:hypothetical protein